MHPSDAVRLPLLAALAVLAIVILIARVRLHAFLAITVVSLALAICAGMTPSTAVRAFQDGVGSTLGFIAIVIGLGSIFGKLLAESGAAQVVAATVVAAVGTRALPWAVAALGFVLGLPVFFSVGLVLLFPIVVGLAASSGRPLLTLALPLVAGLSASHGLVPPHPGPLAAIERVGADTGGTILFAVLCAIPAVILGGPVAIRLLRPGASHPLPVPDTSAAGPVRTPGFRTSVVTLLLPVLLMLSATIGDFVLASDNVARRWIDFAGSPSVAMLIATLVALRVFGTSCGFPLASIVRFVEDSLGPIASVLLIVGAGGGFGRVLEQAGRRSGHRNRGLGPPCIDAGRCVDPGGAATGRRRLGYRRDHHFRQPDGTGRSGRPWHRTASFLSSPSVPDRSSRRTSTTVGSGW